MSAPVSFAGHRNALPNNPKKLHDSRKTIHAVNKGKIKAVESASFGI
jgi:hypothetical protein